MQVTRGAVVQFNYTLTDDDGNILDSNADCDPLAYLHGYDNIIPGLERGLEGSSAGYKSQVVVEATDGYGEADEEAIFEVARDQFPEGVPIEPGMQFVGETPSGDTPLKVVAVNENEVVVDANHPLAGKRLHFDVEVVDVRPASDEELQLGYPQSSEE
jgi:FKBP-type peptidyl-prolyl cis-trans isomerase SlyD